MASAKNISWIVGWLCMAGLLAAPALAGDGRVLGTAPGDAERISITELLASPDGYVGKTVQVEGLVTEVCPRRGCWMMLADNNEQASEIRIKVEDDVIVFPADAKGRPALAEGVFTARELTLKQTVDYLEHQAEELGRPFDPGSVTEPMTLYQIDGTGAIIR